MSEERFEALEIKLVFQEDMIQKLDDALVSQQQQIFDLQVLVRHLGKQIKEVEGQQAPDASEPPPPHY